MENKVEEIEIKSVVEYITEVNKLLKKSKFKPNTHTAFFRGHANKVWKLEPGLLRNDGYIENVQLLHSKHQNFPLVLLLWIIWLKCNIMDCQQGY